jgi:hypothetical protein
MCYFVAAALILNLGMKKSPIYPRKGTKRLRVTTLIDELKTLIHSLRNQLVFAM